MRNQGDNDRLIDEQIEKEFRALEQMAKIQEINRANNKERKNVNIQKEG
tara:strand:- start:230 stop:376 length:147 start_codon:yes stop_codon:yes gene_type:complete